MEIEKGNFDILNVQFGLINGMKINGCRFDPEVYIYSVDEPDFGCEGRKEGQKAYATLYGYTTLGPVKWMINEQTLLETGLFDYMWVGTIYFKDGSSKFIAFRDGSKEWNELPYEKWEEKIPAN